MNIKIEESNGKKKYWVNNVPYNSLEEMPPEYREYFADKNNNGIPDQFDDLMDMTNKMGGSNPFNALFGKGKANAEKTPNTSKKSSTSSSNIDQYLSQQEEKPSGSSTFIKLLILMLVVAAGAWAYVSFNQSDEPSSEGSELSTPAEESADLSVGQESEGDNTKTGLTVVIEDPNEAPYHMLGVIYENDKRVLSFELPDGENGETTDSSLRVAMNIPPGSNLSERTFIFNIRDGECNLADDATDDGKVNIGQFEFSKSESSDAGAGQRYQTYQYSFIKNGKCLSFVLELHSSNAAAFDPPLKEYDEAEQVTEIERILGTLK